MDTIELVFVSLAVAGFGLVLTKRFHIAGLHLTFIASVVGAIFFGAIHLWYLMLGTVAVMTIAIITIAYRLPVKKGKGIYDY